MRILGLEFDNPFTLFLIFILLLGATGYLDHDHDKDKESEKNEAALWNTPRHFRR